MRWISFVADSSTQTASRLWQTRCCWFLRARHRQHTLAVSLSVGKWLSRPRLRGRRRLWDIFLFLQVCFQTLKSAAVDEHARALEEQWIDSMDNAGSASLSLSNSYPTSTFLNGVVMGFFFPLLPWFFFRAPKLAAFWEEESDHEVTGNVMFS